MPERILVYTYDFIFLRSIIPGRSCRWNSKNCDLFFAIFGQRKMGPNIERDYHSMV